MGGDLFLPIAAESIEDEEYYIDTANDDFEAEYQVTTK